MVGGKFCCIDETKMYAYNYIKILLRFISFFKLTYVYFFYFFSSFMIMWGQARASYYEILINLIPDSQSRIKYFFMSNTIFDLNPQEFGLDKITYLKR